MSQTVTQFVCNMVYETMKETIEFANKNKLTLSEVGAAIKNTEDMVKALTILNKTSPVGIAYATDQLRSLALYREFLLVAIDVCTITK